MNRFSLFSYMQDSSPNVVAIAVRMLMSTCSTIFHVSCFIRLEVFKG